jgi:hypothetical protein
MIYLGLFALWNCYDLYRQYLQKVYRETQMKILESSYRPANLSGLLSAMDFNDDADFEISFDGKQAEFLQLAMEDYIKERQSTY